MRGAVVADAGLCSCPWATGVPTCTSFLGVVDVCKYFGYSENVMGPKYFGCSALMDWYVGRQDRSTLRL